MEKTERKMLKKMDKMHNTGKITLEFNLPIKVIPSEIYLLVIEDAKGINQYFLKDGNYDGYCRPYEEK